MSRRTTASVVGFVLLVGCLLAAAVVPLPYTIYSPGPTVNLLGKSDKREIIAVSGAKTYRDGGDLRLLTVVPTGPDDTVSLLGALSAWVRPDQAVYRKSDIYATDQTSDSVEEQGQVDMVDSQDSAVAAALTQLGYTFTTSVQVLGIQRGGPGDGALEVHDQLVSVNGTAVSDIAGAVKDIQAVKPGSRVRLVVRRSGKTQTLRVRTVASQADKTKSALEVTIGVGYDFPIDVDVRVGDNIGGPSAGMMIAMTVYDTLTPGSLTKGADVAGTGTIDAKGQVGGIGGIQQKLVAAQRAGARLFLAPADNCDEVRGGPYDSERMRVVKVSTLKGAIADVKAWTSDHDAKLPAC
ncbi:PDZ domain-containing protein [Nocardioides mangrovicus]|uniref:endopeptidase La n=1 Tax=Nocardioides mangrovicus TaxID=2478913 RepID=A0A3L8P7I6_9ACTN|nr:S16 family serine protease [Nocardioides mangrovicus]RLV50907.1 PDZ domain-containing protein [Nocardioides mangrovicus]